MVGSQSYLKDFMSSNSALLGISGEPEFGFFLGQYNGSNAGLRLKCVGRYVYGCRAQRGSVFDTKSVCRLHGSWTRLRSNRGLGRGMISSDTCVKLCG
jgi:hypothetical protein